MKKVWTQQFVERLFLFLLLCTSLFLFLFNIGNQYLWQDEAQTALISKTILTYGIPRGYDGKNFFSQALGSEYGTNYVWKLHPWLQFFVVAGFFKLFGINAFVARLPFALFGVGCVFLTYVFCKTMWDSKKIAGTTTILLVVSVPFLLLSRQCRYYSMGTFFSLWSLHAYIGLLDKKKHACTIFVLSMILLFHTNYIFCAPLLASIFLHTLLFHRSRLRTVLLAVGIVILINIPWIVWFSMVKYRQSYASGVAMFNIRKLITYANLSFRQISQNLFPLLLLVVIPISILVKKMRTGFFFVLEGRFWKQLALLLFFIFFNIVTVIVGSPFPFLRYMAPLVPIVTILVALLVIKAAEMHIVAAIGIVAILIITSPLTSFLFEITHDFDGPIEGIVKYLKENASEDDTVAITYGDMPLKFYTKMRIVGGLTGEDLSPAKHAKWVIFRKYTLCPKDAAVRKYLMQNLTLGNYKAIVIDYPDTPFENREEISSHYFRTVTHEDRVQILKKVKQ